jgi:ElaB/YqjD/DUF883 family membrane-anchored ribosome-binding protein
LFGRNITDAGEKRGVAERLARRSISAISRKEGIMSDALKAQLASQTHAAANKVESLVSESGDALQRNGAAAVNTARKAFRGKLSAVRGVFAEVPYAVRDKYETVAESMDDYVHDRPWQALALGVGLGVGIGIGLGFLTNLLADRR